jgi:hypothetical protein
MYDTLSKAFQSPKSSHWNDVTISIRSIFLSAMAIGSYYYIYAKLLGDTGLQYMIFLNKFQSFDHPIDLRSCSARKTTISVHNRQQASQILNVSTLKTLPAHCFLVNCQLDVGFRRPIHSYSLIYIRVYSNLFLSPPLPFNIHRWTSY